MTNQVPSTTEIIFFNAQTANATSTPLSFIFPMGSAVVKFWGTWDGATVRFQTAATPLDKNYFIYVPDLNGDTAIFVADGQVNLESMVYGDLLQCIVSNVGGSTSLNVTAQVIRG
jgi:hypothetical protein